MQTPGCTMPKPLMFWHARSPQHNNLWEKMLNATQSLGEQQMHGSGDEGGLQDTMYSGGMLAQTPRSVPSHSSLPSATPFPQVGTVVVVVVGGAQSAGAGQRVAA